eukprot:COSAG02_NODE_60875_length_270_cov_0.602339_1_plen_69_part_01
MLLCCSRHSLGSNSSCLPSWVRAHCFIVRDWAERADWGRCLVCTAVFYGALVRYWLMGLAMAHSHRIL